MLTAIFLSLVVFFVLCGVFAAQIANVFAPVPRLPALRAVVRFSAPVVYPRRSSARPEHAGWETLATALAFPPLARG